MKWRLVPCIFVLAMMIVPATLADAKGGHATDPEDRGFLIVKWDEYYHNYGMSYWGTSPGFNGFDCIVGIYPDDGYSGPGAPYLMYWKEATPADSFVYWYLPVECPVVDDHKFWWVNIWINAHIGLPGYLGDSVDGCCVYSERWALGYNLYTSIDVLPEVYREEGPLPTAAVQWVGTTMGAPMLSWTSSVSGTASWKAGVGVEAGVNFVTSYLDVSWWETTSYSYSTGQDPVPFLTSEGAYIGYTDMTKYHVWDIWGNEIRFNRDLDPDSHFLGTFAYTEKIQPTYEEAMYQISIGNTVGYGTETIPSSQWFDRPFPCSIRRYEVSLGSSTGWKVGGGIGVGVPNVMFVGFQVEVTHTDSSTFTYSRHIALQYDPGPNYVVQTWTPHHLIDPTTGATLYNTQWITYCYLVPV